MKKLYLGIDPGKDGALVILNEDSEILEIISMPLIGREYNKRRIREILLQHPYHKIGLENPNTIAGVSKSSTASLSHCVGLIEGMMIGLELPHLMIHPKEWQKECWKYVKTQKKTDGKTDTKATSELAALNFWPRDEKCFKITAKGNPSKNSHDGIIDAALIAEYVRRTFK